MPPRMAGPGIEPGYRALETRVLPLDDPASLDRPYCLMMMQ